MVPLHLTLPATPASIAVARSALAPLRDDVGDPAFRDLRLLVSEVVTNAVRHADHDGGTGFAADPLPTPARDREAGWGLYLVNKLTRSWGAERVPDAHVWFELEH